MKCRGARAQTSRFTLKAQEGITFHHFGIYVTKTFCSHDGWFNEKIKSMQQKLLSELPSSFLTEPGVIMHNTTQPKTDIQRGDRVKEKTMNIWLLQWGIPVPLLWTVFRFLIIFQDDSTPWQWQWQFWCYWESCWRSKMYCCCSSFMCPLT